MTWRCSSITYQTLRLDWRDVECLECVEIPQKGWWLVSLHAGTQCIYVCVQWIVGINFLFDGSVSGILILLLTTTHHHLLLVAAQHLSNPTSIESAAISLAVISASHVDLK